MGNLEAPSIMHLWIRRSPILRYHSHRSDTPRFGEMSLASEQGKVQEFGQRFQVDCPRMYTLESSEKRTHTSTKPRFIWRLLLLPSSLLISLFLLWSHARCGFRPVPLALSQPHLGKQPQKFTQQRASMVSTNLWFLCGDVKFH